MSWVLICRKSKPNCLGICLDIRYIDIYTFPIEHPSFSEVQQHLWAFMTGTDIGVSQIKDKPKFYVLQGNVWAGQPKTYETVLITIRTISSPSNGGRKPLRENHHGIGCKEWQTLHMWHGVKFRLLKQKMCKIVWQFQWYKFYSHMMNIKGDVCIILR